MKNDTLKEFTEVMQGVLSELTNIRMLMEKQAFDKEEKLKKVAKDVASFDDHITYYGLSPLLSFDNQPIKEMYDKYVKYCPLGKYEPISQSRFTRLVHKMGYGSKTKKVNGTTIRIFVKKNM